MWLLFACTTQEIKQEAPPKKEEVQEIVEEEIEEEEILEPLQITSIEFTHPEPKATDPIEVEVKAKRPKSGGLRYEYEWSINGRKQISEKSSALKRAKIKKGDSISVTVTIRNKDRELSKKTEVKILNSPPQWEADPRLVREIDGFKVKAFDPDGDPIKYRLEGQPRGMTISSNGELHYKGSTTEPGGKYNIAVIAEDNERGLVKWDFSISLTPGSDAKK